jgi:hypothetical protein
MRAWGRPAFGRQLGGSAAQSPDVDSGSLLPPPTLLGGLRDASGWWLYSAMPCAFRTYKETSPFPFKERIIVPMFQVRKMEVQRGEGISSKVPQPASSRSESVGQGTAKSARRQHQAWWKTSVIPEPGRRIMSLGSAWAMY